MEPTLTVTIRVGKEGRPEEAFSLSSDRKLNGTTISSMALKLKRITAASAFDLQIEQLEVGSQIAPLQNQQPIELPHSLYGCMNNHFMPIPKS